MDNKNKVKNLWKILKRVVPIKPLRKQPQQIEVDGKFIMVRGKFQMFLINILCHFHNLENLDARGDNPEMVAFLNNLFHEFIALVIFLWNSTNHKEECLRYHDLMYLNQSGFRINHSCETALINMTDKWLKAMDDDGELVGAVFMDLIKGLII